MEGQDKHRKKNLNLLPLFHLFNTLLNCWYSFCVGEKMKSTSKKKELERARWLTSSNGADFLNRREKFVLILLRWSYKAKIIDIKELVRRTDILLFEATVKGIQKKGGKGGLNIVLLEEKGKNGEKGDDPNEEV